MEAYSLKYLKAHPPKGMKAPDKVRSPLEASTVIRVCREENFPLELFLALAWVETGGGLLEVGAKTKNPLNFGNDEAGNTKSFANWEDGIRGCIRGMRRAGFRGEFSTAEDILFRKKLVGYYGDYCAYKGTPYATNELPMLIKQLLDVMLPKGRPSKLT